MLVAQSWSARLLQPSVSKGKSRSQSKEHNLHSCSCAAQPHTSFTPLMQPPKLIPHLNDGHKLQLCLDLRSPSWHGCSQRCTLHLPTSARASAAAAAVGWPAASTAAAHRRCWEHKHCPLMQAHLAQRLLYSCTARVGWRGKEPLGHLV